jgi:predicted secreted protein
MIMTGKGTKFSIGSGSPLTYTDVANVATITPPQLTRDTVDVDTLDPADGYKQFLTGLKDGGEVGITLNFDPEDTGQTSIYNAFENDTPGNYKITFPDGSNWTFSGLLTAYEPQDVAAADVVQVQVTIKVSGKPTFTAGV